MDLLQIWHDAARRYIPDGAAVWDAHTHSGLNDPDGVRSTAERLIEKLRAADQAGAVVMTNQDPDGYPRANDRILAEAEESDGLLVPFLRVDPRTGREALVEVERSLDAGHRGIKLHPRAESFELSDPIVRDVASIAAERSVPMLAHAGRGIPSLGRDAIRLCEQVDGLNLILAHAAISDLSWLAAASADVPGLFFDTAWWDVTDLLALFAWAPPGRIVYASDTPYGQPQLSSTLTVRVAITAGYDDSRLRAMLGGTLVEILAGRRPADLGPAPGDGFVPGDAGLIRIHASLHGAITHAFASGDASEEVSLARLGCEVPSGSPHAAVYEAIARTLDAIDLTSGRRSVVVRPLLAAATAALTPDAGVPDSAAFSSRDAS